MPRGREGEIKERPRCRGKKCRNAEMPRCSLHAESHPYSPMAFFARPSPTSVRISQPAAHPPSTTAAAAAAVPTPRQCRNIVIYGHCKFQDKGCAYHHPTQQQPTLVASAPVFVPRGAAAQDDDNDNDNAQAMYDYKDAWYTHPAPFLRQPVRTPCRFPLDTLVSVSCTLAQLSSIHSQSAPHYYQRPFSLYSFC